MRWAAANELRTDYDLTTGDADALIENAATNLWADPEDATKWNKSQVDVVENVGVDPEGGLTLDRIVPTTTSSAHYTSRIVSSVAAGQRCAFSLFSREDGYRYLRLSGAAPVFSDAEGRLAAFDLQTGTVTGTQGSVTAKIENVGGGLYRCQMSMTAIATGTGGHAAAVNNAPGTGLATFIGDGVSGIQMGYAQFEVGPVATSYTRVPRAADIVSAATGGFQFNPTEGTLYVECIHLTTPSSGTAGLAALDGAGGSTIRIRHGQVITGADFYVQKDGAGQVDTGSFAVVLGALTKYAYAYKADDFAFCRNGAAVLTDSSGQVPTVSSLVLSASTVATRIRRMIYYPRRLSNAELQAMTS
ncbi:phage head spike fiber domain-containing protein [Pseudaminobacter sp. NGMCC 1.201702]|uniref:phage head spike fiber domain-containing protein n=1 Tax=Pseudaminobacter sp. NGMCC 1.201702 TaxID=3391825 RepID=UPI0039F0D4D8